MVTCVVASTFGLVFTIISSIGLGISSSGPYSYRREHGPGGFATALYGLQASTEHLIQFEPRNRERRLELYNCTCLLHLKFASNMLELLTWEGRIKITLIMLLLGVGDQTCREETVLKFLEPYLKTYSFFSRSCWP